MVAPSPRPTCDSTTPDATNLNALCYRTKCYGPPDVLTVGKRFVGYRLEARKDRPKPAKMPYSPDAPKGASSTDPSHWTTFDDATAYARVAGLDGVMRAFVESDGLVGTDLDHCLDPSIEQPSIDDLAPWAAAIVKRQDTYTEVSPSGTGVKLWCYASLPPHGRKRGDVEMYSSARFFTLTGRHLAGTPDTVGYRPDAVLAIHREVFGDETPITTLGVCEAPPEPSPASERTDDDVVRLASESPHNGPAFRALHAGDIGGYPSESEADAAYCELTAFYAGPRPEQIERIWLGSALGAREKVRRADYRERTIRFVLRGKTRFYGDSIVAAPRPSDGTNVDALPRLRARTAYLERALLDRDDLAEHQQLVIRAERAAKEAAVETVRGISAILARPKAHLADDFKVFTIQTILEAHSRASRGIASLPSVALEGRTGQGKNKISDHVRDLAARDGSPIRRHKTREWRTNDDGIRESITVSLVAPLHATVAESLAAVLTMGGPSTEAARRRHADRERAAHARGAWGRCPSCDNDAVAVTGKCPTHGRIVGETVVRREDFALLIPGFRESADGAAPPVLGRINAPGFRDSGDDDARAHDVDGVSPRLGVRGSPRAPALPSAGAGAGDSAPGGGVAPRETPGRGAPSAVRQRVCGADAALAPDGTTAPGLDSSDAAREAGVRGGHDAGAGGAPDGDAGSGDHGGRVGGEAALLAGLTPEDARAAAMVAVTLDAVQLRAGPPSLDWLDEWRARPGPGDDPEPPPAASCIFACDNLAAVGDLIACAEHRAAIEAAP
jgi:putative DNA primase/helicase